jgi:hypothetical protein
MPTPSTLDYDEMSRIIARYRRTPDAKWSDLKYVPGVNAHPEVCKSTFTFREAILIQELQLCTVCFDLPTHAVFCTNCLTTICMKAEDNGGPGCLFFNATLRERPYTLCHICLRKKKSRFLVCSISLFYYPY